MQSPSAAALPFVLIASVAIAGGLTPTTAAQQPVPVAYPLDSVTGTWNNCGPLGQNNTGMCDEARAQMLIPQAYLPSTGGVITGIEVVVTSPYVPSVTYEVLDINMGVTTAQFLSTTFATNLPAPILVFSLRPPNSTINYTASGWTLLNLQTPFPYGGTGNLVIEFRKAVNQPPQSRVNTYMTVPSDPRRFHLPQQVTRSGAFGSGAINAPIGGAGGMPIRMRLWFQSGRSLTVQNARGGLHNFEFSLGSLASMTVHGQSGDLYGCFVDFQGLGFANAPWGLPGLQGLCHLNVTPPWLITVGQGVIGSGNTGVSTFQVPADPWFVGKKLALQAVVGTTGSGFSFTPAADAVVNW
jgi:hypothetical protein